MTSELFVFRDRDQVGQVKLDDKRRWLFVYNPQWVIRPDAFPISVRLPLQDAVIAPDHARAFFANLLPEGNVRSLIAKKKQVSVDNDFALLSAIGGDCAGALSLQSSSKRIAKEENYREISIIELNQFINDMRRHPLLTIDGQARLSLAGAQEKLPVYCKLEKIFIPENGAPSSHILKPAIPEFQDSVHNEVFCMQLARKMNVSVPMVDILHVMEHVVFITERYDRKRHHDGSVGRLHQEDFCQALGMMAGQKYQNEGGPSFADCAQVIDHYSSVPALDKQRLIAWAIFNFLIGNCDAHAKNISILISADSIQLTPFYDLMSTVIYEGLSEKMAMKIGGHYERNIIVERHWKKFADDIGVNPIIVLQILKEFSDVLPKLVQTEARRFVAQYGGAETIFKIVAVIEASVKRFM